MSTATEGVIQQEPVVEEESWQKAILRDYAETILICVIFVIFSRAFVFQQSKIPSGSMMDTLLIGDYIMVNRFVYAPTSFDWEHKLLPSREIRRGDVVVFKQPRHPEQDYIKRVVGLPGETVELRQGYLYVNGRRVYEPYIDDDYRRQDKLRNYGPYVVPDGNYYVMGDHRNKSADSRAWGPVPREVMKGRALLIWWSFDEAKSNPDPFPNALERIKSWAVKAIFFLPRSRWERCFKLIR
ncbi:MAG: signal peptidase I [bacterium]|nr:signal peptidase I [bacterium]